MAPEPSELVVRLDGRGVPNPVAGGKGSALDRLVALGANVPDTSVVTTAAYRTFVSDPGLSALLEELRTGPLPEPEDHARERARVDDAFLEVDLTSQIAEAIAENGPPVGGGHLIAVRSSATAEDTASASFAGQYSSFLNVDEGDVSRAVRLVWSSLWHPAPRSYRRFRNIDENDLAMAAVLMAMLDPSHAGVIFTTDPGGAADHIRLEVVEGLAESLVSGDETPDAYVVPRHSSAEHLSKIEPVFGALVTEAMRIEDEQGAPQDIEWAVEDGVLFLVQARPITTDATVVGTDDGFDVHSGLDATYTTAGIGETLPGVLPPLAWDINSWALENGFRSLFDSLGGVPDGIAGPHALIGRFRGRAALNLDVMLRATGSIPGASPEELEQQYFGQAVRSDEDRPAPTPGKAGAAQGVRTLRARQAAALESEVVINAVRLFLDDEPGLEACDNDELLAYRGRLLHLALRAVTVEVSVAAMATASYRSIEVFLTQHLGQGDASRAAQLMTAGSGGSRRATIALAMSALVETANAHPELRDNTNFDTWEAAERQLAASWRGRDFLTTFHRALERAGSTSYFGGPTWAEVPELAWLMFRQESTADGNQDDDDRARQEARDQIEAKLVADPHWTYNRWASGQVFDIRRRFFRREAADAAEFLDRREHTKAAMLMLGGAMRRLNLELGQRLVDAGALEDAEDVTMVGFSEVADMIRSEGPTLDTIAVRRRRLAEAGLDGPLPRVFDGLPGVEDKPEITGEHLTGWGASPGRYEGPVRVVRSVTESRLVRGDVLVATATDASWAPLFLLAGAIVVEEGGPLSHAAIVARELGMPAVVNVPGIVDHLDSQSGPLTLTVDGTTGEIVISTGEALEPSVGAGVAPLRTPVEPEQQLDRLNVFVTGLIGAGALFSTVIALTESMSSRRGRTRLFRKAYPIAETLSEATRSGYDETLATRAGIRPRSHYLLAALALAAAAAVLAIVSTRAYVAGDAGTSSNVAYWAVSMSGSATLAMLAVYFGNAVVEWPRVLPTVRRLAPSRPVHDRVWLRAIGTTRLTVIAVLLMIVGVLGVLAAVADSVLLDVDRQIYEDISAGKDVARYGPDFLNWLGRPIVIIPLAIAIGLAMIRCRVIALAFPLAVVAAGVSNVLLGYLVRRERPPLSDHFGEVTSFPGGHFMQMTLLFGVLPIAAHIMTGRVMARNTTIVLSVPLLALILTDTFRTGGHWPLDQLAGFLIGASLVIAIWGLQSSGEHHDSCSDCPSKTGS